MWTLSVRHLAASAPDTPLVICGVSLGGNVLLKWLGEQGTTPTADWFASSGGECSIRSRRGIAISGTWILALLYKDFLATLLPKAERKLEQFPGAFDAAAARRAKPFGSSIAR